MSGYDGEVRINTRIETKQLNSQMMQLESRMEKSARKAQMLKDEVRKLEEAKVPTEEYKDISDSFRKSNAELDRLLQKQDSMAARGKDSGVAWEEIQRKIESVGADIKASENYLSQMVKDGTAFQNMKESDKYKKLTLQLKDCNQEMEILQQKHKELEAKQMQKLANAAKKTSGLFSNLLSRLKGITLSLLIFNWITKGFNVMMAAFRDGIQNMAKYSSDFNARMSEMKSATATLKASLGTLAVPIVEALTPAIVSLCGWLTNAINAINKFIAAVKGKSTWTKAKKQQVDYAKSLDKTANSAKKAQGALANFDDLNVLQKSDTSEGGTTATGSGNGGYEEVPISEKDFEWIDKVKKAFETMLPVVILIGAALATWGIANLLSGLMEVSPLLGGLLAVIAIIGGLVLAVVSYFGMWKDGVDWEGLIGYIAGVALVTAGLFALFGPVAAGIALIIAGIAGLILALVDIYKNGLNTKNMTLLLISAFGILAGVFMAFGAPAAIVVGALMLIIAGITDLIQHGVNLKNGIMIVVGVFLVLMATVGTVVAAIAALIVGLVLAVAADWDNFKKTVWEPMKVWAKTLLDNFSQIGRGVMNIFSGIIDFIKGVFTGDWKLAWSGIEKFFSGIWDTIVGCLKASVNIIIGVLNTVYNSICGVINACINAINKIKFTVPDFVPVIGGKEFGGFNIPTISTINIPYLANGGITTGETLAKIGEAGQEAVLPLENNTGWMDDFASKLVGKMSNGNKTVILQLDGKKLAQTSLPYFSNESYRLGIETD